MTAESKIHKKCKYYKYQANLYSRQNWASHIPDFKNYYEVTTIKLVYPDLRVGIIAKEIDLGFKKKKELRLSQLIDFQSQ